MKSGRDLEWVGSSLDDLKALPRQVVRAVGFALRTVQDGERPPNATPLQGFGSASVLEIKVDHDTNTYRAVYTVQFADTVYVLHVFLKRSKRGAATPQRDLELIRRRLAAVVEQRRREGRS